MFKHNECDSEVEVKICDNGDLMVCCPKCKRVWATTLAVVPVVKGARGKYRVVPNRLEVLIAPMRMETELGKLFEERLGSEVYSGVVHTTSERISNAAVRAFPQLFQ